MKANMAFFTLIILSVGSLSVKAAGREFSGGGGFYIGAYNPDLKFLDDKLAQVTPGFKKVERTKLAWGGLGWGEVSENWRIGGYGFGSSQQVSGVYRTAQGDLLPQDVYFEYGGGGFYVERVLGHFLDKFEGNLNFGLGGISYSIRVCQYEQLVSWDNLMGGLNPALTPQTFNVDMTTGGMLLNPGLGLKYYILDFMAVEVNVSYLMALMMSDWKFNEASIRGMPDVNLNAPTLNLRFIFGG